MMMMAISVSQWRPWRAPISNPFTYLAAVCICAIIPTLEGSIRANMHLTFGIERTATPSEGSLIRVLKREMHSTIYTLMLQDAADRFCL